ncbi:hypothetical protein B0I35DRAFT_474790 [Stachybotrys elegans]|uniref:DUF952 domain-containing protein n=1 Tax=Stachybotrys elegans TaxID=80388 RepID=A0A8K0SYJ2_9HYPO|nr:hypothetical protein B0I35DRAFT_474790 [Stachybotrys elegans]
MAPNPLPKYIYKISPTPPPQPIPAEYPLSELDQKDGFIHFSTATQVPQTADLFFTSASELWIMKLELAKWGPAIKWEGEGDGFPHLYGNFGKDDVLSVEKFEREEGKEWSVAMTTSSWLE